MENLNTSLNLYHMDILKEIAQTLEIELNRYPLHKSWLIQRLLDRIPRLAASRSFIKSLGEAPQAALSVMLERDRVYTQRDVALPLMLSGIVYVEGQSATLTRPKIADVLHTLLVNGLIVNLTEPMGTASRRTLSPLHIFAIPPQVRRVLPVEVLHRPQIRSGEFDLTDTPERVMSGDMQQFLRSLFFTWAELRREPARRLKAGTMGKRDRRRIAESLGLEGDEGLAEVAWLHEFLDALNLVNHSGDVIRGIDRAAVKLFWSTTSAGKMSDLIVAYVRMESDLNLNAQALSSYTFQSSVPLRSPADIRTNVVETLNQVAQAGWLPFDLFFDLVTGGQIGSLVLEPSVRTSLYGDLHWYGGTSRRLAMESTLQRIETQAAVKVLKELSRMGLVALGYASQEAQRPTSLKLSSWLRAHYTNHTTTRPTEGGQIILQPDFQILAMGPVPLSVLADLERFAVREKLDESVVTYRITRDSVYQAFQQAMTASAIQEMLDEASDQPVPQNVVRSLHDWQQQYERIIIRRAVTILQVDEPERLTALLEDSALKTYLHKLDERTAWFATPHASRVEARLAELETLPGYSSDPERDIAASLRWEGDHLTSRHPLPSLYVEGRMDQIAERKDGHWVLSPAQIKQAVDQGLEPVAIIEMLERMTGSPLDFKWQKRLKAWGQHYGPGQVAEVKLLRLASDDVMQELRETDPRLGEGLLPLPEANGMAVVKEKHWDEVRDALEEWGINPNEVHWWAQSS
jgi:hypothetical protein